ncbi:hypothetical protein PR048_010786 [Dryococelus australis]|uniref:Uncharacterized protein n=1 Tax=Dryococelus australis TaxID=614101 RepID=A0ABQ9I3N3_9NEOP|nr:hypothetical protein PR048_010786 [Dryococelus australis]
MDCNGSANRIWNANQPSQWPCRYCPSEQYHRHNNCPKNLHLDRIKEAVGAKKQVNSLQRLSGQTPPTALSYCPEQYSEYKSMELQVAVKKHAVIGSSFSKLVKSTTQMMSPEAESEIDPILQWIIWLTTKQVEKRVMNSHIVKNILFSKIDADEGLDNSDKFHYVVQATRPGSRAREVVESFPIVGENYPKAVDR